MNAGAELNQPPLQRDAVGNVDVDSVPDVIEWFLNNDQRVAVVKHPSVRKCFNGSSNRANCRARKSSFSTAPKIGSRSGLFRHWLTMPPNAICMHGSASC